MPAMTQKQIDALIAETRAIETREGVPVDEAFVRAWLRSMVRPIVSALRRPRSLSPALEGDLAAFGPSSDFARAVERVGEVEQGRTALPFALGQHLGGTLSQRLGIHGAFLCGPFGFLPGAAIDPYFHAAKLRASVVARQCNAFPVSHPPVSHSEVVR